MRGRLEDVRAAGAELIFIGNGAVHFAKHFAEKQVPGCEVYTDPSRESYVALGLKRTLLGVMGPRSLLAGLRATRAGYVQKSVEGDGMQLGGFFAVAHGRIVHADIHSSAGDRPDVGAALKALAAAGTPPPPASPGSPPTGRGRVA